MQSHFSPQLLLQPPDPPPAIPRKFSPPSPDPPNRANTPQPRNGQDELNELRTWLAAPEGSGAKDEYRQIAQLRDLEFSIKNRDAGNGEFLILKMAGERT